MTDEKEPSDDSCNRMPLTSTSLPTTSQPLDVPVFNCVVHVKSISSGVEMRVANLAGIVEQAANERAGLAVIVSRFKAATAEFLQDDGTIPWIDPIPDPGPDEQVRFIPVHL